MICDIGWADFLLNEFRQEYMIQIADFLIKERESGKNIYPDTDDIFNVFKHSFGNIKVVILGQDVYHTPNVTHGYAFSSKKENYIPPSLKNIFREIYSDLGIKPLDNPNLIRWTNQGVFLLNTILTVREGSPLSHKGIGWETFTDKVIGILNESNKKLVFMLWGKFAKEYRYKITNNHHLILEASHPAAEIYGHGGFFGCQHFSKCNDFLKNNKCQEINWR